MVIQRVLAHLIFFLTSKRFALAAVLFIFSSVGSAQQVGADFVTLERKMARAPDSENVAETKKRVFEQLQFYERRPFWKQRLGLERQVWVEVDHRAVGAFDQGVQLDLRGAGAVKVPTERVFREIQNFERLPQVSDYFKKVVWNKEKNELYIEIEALGYQSKFVMDVIKDEINKRLVFYVREGSFSGMHAIFEVKEFERRHALIVLSASLIRNSLGLPSGLVSFGIEALGEKVAQKMRSHLESEYKK